MLCRFFLEKVTTLVELTYRLVVEQTHVSCIEWEDYRIQISQFTQVNSGTQPEINSCD